ncbi:MFS transporter [Rhizorhabdus dicambivorans]|uniref:MFS transporter n=1 Tax=Rhizorhabdus dicambivorans TaxID=1850238 RepID=UPI0008332BAB|nr:MFS transporter [Rhizorhabdus dicambivorans]
MRQVQYLVFCFSFLVAVADGFDQTIVSIVGPVIVKSGVIGLNDLGFVFFAGLIGYVPGSFLLGAAADRWGRRPLIVIALFILAVGSAGTALSRSLGELFIARFVTSLGIGGAAPCLIALAAEYSPRRLRTFIVALMWAGIPFGGILSGLTASIWLARLGWEAMFGIAAACTVLLAVIVQLVVPESPEFLVVKGGREDAVRNILERLGGGTCDEPLAPVPTPLEAPSSPKELFAAGFVRGTTALWIAMFAGFMQLIMISQYTPILLQIAGMRADDSGKVFTLFYVGSIVGTALAGPAIARVDGCKATAGWLVAAGAATAFFGGFASTVDRALVGITLVGLLQGLGLGALIAISASLYPAHIRSTGFGWAVGVSRLGGAAAPLLAAQLVSRHTTQVAFYMVVASIALLAALAVWFISAERSPRDASLSSR